MEKKPYDYNEWLSTHAKSKTMMEKLERSLIPFDLFAAIGLKNDKQEHERPARDEGRLLPRERVLLLPRGRDLRLRVAAVVGDHPAGVR